MLRKNSIGYDLVSIFKLPYTFRMKEEGYISLSNKKRDNIHLQVTTFSSILVAIFSYILIGKPAKNHNESKYYECNR